MPIFYYTYWVIIMITRWHRKTRTRKYYAIIYFAIKILNINLAV